jgi:endonuclease/exonuclease/phosphatase family metal-dependent hydrolase
MHADRRDKQGEKNAGKMTDAGFDLRVMTYNIHSCVNMDGKILPQRIINVVRQFDPDVIALQEVDADRPQTHNQNQAKIISNALGMDYRFFPVVTNGAQQYGLAILSHLAFQNITVGWLPTWHPKLKLNLEKRGVMWAILETSSGPVHFFNTHLSLHRFERRSQVKALLGEDWLQGVPQEEAIVLCSDLNAVPFSPVYRRLSRRFADVQKSSLHAARVQPTFPSRRPVFRIDHIFISKHFRTLKTAVPVNADTRLASDHLPICADLKMTRSC